MALLTTFVDKHVGATYKNVNFSLTHALPEHIGDESVTKCHTNVLFPLLHKLTEIHVPMEISYDVNII